MKTPNTHKESSFHFNARSHRKAPAALAAAFLAGGLLLTGCGSKDESDSPVTAGQGSPKTAQANFTGTSGVKPTPEQEAAKQCAIDEGPAIQAANNPPEGGK